MLSRGVQVLAAHASCQPAVGEDQSFCCPAHLTSLPRREQRPRQGQANPFHRLTLLLSLLFAPVCVDSSLWSSWEQSWEQIVPVLRPGCSGVCTSPGAFPPPLQVLSLQQEHQPLLFSHFSEVTWEGAEVKCLKLPIFMKANKCFKYKILILFCSCRSEEAFCISAFLLVSRFPTQCWLTLQGFSCDWISNIHQTDESWPCGAEQTCYI